MPLLFYLQNVDELLEYIESSESNGKKTSDKKTGLKHNGTLVKESSSKHRSIFDTAKNEGILCLYYYYYFFLMKFEFHYRSFIIYQK